MTTDKTETKAAGDEIFDDTLDEISGGRIKAAELMATSTAEVRALPNKQMANQTAALVQSPIGPFRF